MDSRFLQVIFKHLQILKKRYPPSATRSGTGRHGCVDTIDLVITKIFSNPMIITRYGNISL